MPDWGNDRKKHRKKRAGGAQNAFARIIDEAEALCQVLGITKGNKRIVIKETSAEKVNAARNKQEIYP